LFVSATGALTALGDTLYPVQAAALGERWASDQATSAHFLERLRILHPIVAVCTALFLFRLGSGALERLRSRAGLAFARCLIALVLVQLAVGCANVLLSAPGYLQVVHLLLASLVWLALVLLGVEARDPRTAPAA
jgi:heme A synthase